MWDSFRLTIISLYTKIVVLFEFRDRRGERVLSDWPLDRQKRRKLDRLLDALQRVDRDLAVGSLVFKRKRAAGIYYAKIHGKVQLRPRLCIGPFEDDQLTFLLRAEERDRKTIPADADSRAVNNLEQIRQDPMRHWRPL